MFIGLPQDSLRMARYRARQPMTAKRGTTAATLGSRGVEPQAQTAMKETCSPAF